MEEELFFNISKHPDMNYSRKVWLDGPYVSFRNRTVVCPIDIVHYDESGNIVQNGFVKTERVALMTSNNKYVNSQGQRVDLIEESYLDENQESQIRLIPPQTAIPEFDFLFAYVSPTENADLGAIILEVIAFMIARNDANGNFNDLSNFNG